MVIYYFKVVFYLCHVVSCGFYFEVYNYLLDLLHQHVMFVIIVIDVKEAMIVAVMNAI